MSIENCVFLNSPRPHLSSLSGGKLVCLGWWGVHLLESTQLLQLLVFHDSRTHMNSRSETNIYTFIHTHKRAPILARTHTNTGTYTQQGRQLIFPLSSRRFRSQWKHNRCHIYLWIIVLKDAQMSPGLIWILTDPAIIKFFFILLPRCQHWSLTLSP